MMVAAAAACAILAAVGVGGYAYAMAPVAHVGIDVNPSFELSLNRFDRVVQARAVDEEAAEVLERIDIDGARYEDAMETLASACRSYTGEEASVEVAWPAMTKSAAKRSNPPFCAASKAMRARFIAAG